MSPEPKKLLTADDLLLPEKDVSPIGDGSTLQPISGMVIDGLTAEQSADRDNCLGSTELAKT